MLNAGDKVIFHFRGGIGEVRQPVYGTIHLYLIKSEEGNYRVIKESQVVLVSSPEGQQIIILYKKIDELDDQVGKLYQEIEALFPQPKRRKPKEAPQTT